MIKPLTSLRFFFAFFVFLSHLSYLNQDNTYKEIFNAVFSEGFLGVSFFFILSGFILALNYKDKLIEKKITLKKFYIARFARIYPLYFVTMIASIPAFYSTIKILLYNIFLIQSYIPDPKIFFSYNAPSWSISDEMFFYALFPLLIVGIYRLNYIFKWVILAVIISVIILLNTILTEESQAHYWLYVSPFIRIFDFTLGILLFEVVLYFKKIAVKKNFFNFLEIGAIITFITFFIFHQNISISYRFSIYYWLPMCLIILSASNSYILGKDTTWFSKLLSSKILVYLGEISFGFYLIHYLILTYTNKFNGFFGIHLKTLPYAVEMFIITVITSIFAFECIEKPLNRKIKNLFS